MTTKKSLLKPKASNKELTAEEKKLVTLISTVIVSKTLQDSKKEPRTK